MPGSCPVRISPPSRSSSIALGPRRLAARPPQSTAVTARHSGAVPAPGHRRAGARRPSSAATAAAASRRRVAGLEPSPQSARPRSSSSGARPDGRVAGQHHHDLAPHLALGERRRRRRPGSPATPPRAAWSARGPPTTSRSGPHTSEQVTQRRRQPARRLEEDHACGLARRRLRSVGGGRSRAGGGIPRSRTGRWGARSPPRPPAPRSGPGTRVTVTPASAAAATSRRPGSDTAGVPASLTTATVRPSARWPRTASRRAISLWSCSDSSLTPFRPGVGQQPTGATSVLAAHDVGMRQRLESTRRQVTQVPDRAWTRGRACPRPRSPVTGSWSSSLSPTRRPQRSKAPASASSTMRARQRGSDMRHGREADDVDHAQLTVEEGHVDGRSASPGCAPTGSGAR